MKANLVLTAVTIGLVSIGAYAQTPSGQYNGKRYHSPEKWAAKRAERKLNMQDMTRSERKAFKQAHREQRLARLNAMTPEKRARVLEHRRPRQEAP